MPNVPPHIVEQLRSAVTDEVAEINTTNVPPHIVEELLRLSLATTLPGVSPTRLKKCLDLANQIKQQYKIYPYHDGTVEVYRPVTATLKPTVPASD